MLKITLTSGLVGKKDTQRRVITALGLRKYGSSVEHADTPTIQGMLRKVHHLVTVTPSESNGAGSDAKHTTAKPAKKPAATATKTKAESK